MANPNAFEQELLELINRARANPAGEFDALIKDAATRTGVTQEISNALQYFNVDMAMLRSQLNQTTAVAPLAWNSNLNEAARTHTQLLIRHDAQSHQLPGEAGLGERVTTAGYTNWSRVAENVYSYTTDPVHGHAGFYIDWGNGPGGIQNPAGHRNTILSNVLTEVGISAIAENNPATQVGPHVVTQNFGTRFNYTQQLVGVIYGDRDGDAFYDAGEGIGGMIITATGNGRTFTTTSWESGGYQVELPAGTYDVTFSGAGLRTAITQSVTIGSVNVKLDLDTSNLPAQNPPLIGTAGADWLVARTTGHAIDGLGGNDMADFNAVQASITVNLATGVATAGSETWDLNSIERVTGTSWGDLLIGDEGNNHLRAMGDYDWIVGSGGNDTLDGGGGRDTVAYTSATSGITASLVTNRGTRGQADGDIYISIENLTGSSYADVMYGNDEANILRGMAGDDIIYGGGGRDTIDGGAGHDLIYGGAGNDRITGGPGRDTIDGGTGWDTAIYSGARADYTIQSRTDGYTVVTHNNGGIDGTDFLINIDVIEFMGGGRYYLS